MHFHQFDITIQDLQVFLAVAECLSFSGAAKLVGKSQPSVSSRIKKLEERLQIPLFVRDANSVRLSEEGKEFQRDALKVVDEMAEFYDKYHEKGERRKSVVRVCSPIMIGSTIVKVSTDQFQEYNPGILLEFADDTPDNCVQRVLNGKSDVAVIPIIDLPPEADFRLVFTDICKVISAPDHPLTQKISASIADILKYPILCPNTHVEIREKLLREADKRNIKISFVAAAAEVTSHMSLVAMASSNLGVAITSAKFIPETFQQGIGMTKIDDCKLTRSFGLVTAKDKNQSTAVMRFCDYLINIGSLMEIARGPI
jgi:DNA-binding transcriptional LysR family regulator